MHVAKLTFFTWFSVGLIRECNYRIHVFSKILNKLITGGPHLVQFGEPPQIFFQKKYVFGRKFGILLDMLGI